MDNTSVAVSIDPLEGQPLGRCPECGVLVGDNEDGGSYHNSFEWDIDHWDDSMTETENRIRYAAQRLEESAMYKRIEREGWGV